MVARWWWWWLGLREREAVWERERGNEWENNLKNGKRMKILLKKCVE